MKKLLIALVAGLPVLALHAQDNGSSLEADDFRSAMSRPGVELIDLRPAEAFQAGHLEGATHLDLEDGTLLEHLAGHDKEKPVLLYCGSGYRSGQAKATLIETGFTHVYDLKDGMEALENAQKSTEQ